MKTVPPAGFDWTARFPAKTGGGLGSRAGCRLRVRWRVVTFEPLDVPDADLIAAGRIPGVVGAVVAAGIGDGGIGDGGIEDGGIEAAAMCPSDVCCVMGAGTSRRGRRATRPPTATTANSPSRPAATA